MNGLRVKRNCDRHDARCHGQGSKSIGRRPPSVERESIKQRVRYSPTPPKQKFRAMSHNGDTTLKVSACAIAFLPAFRSQRRWRSPPRRVTHCIDI
jgi:hypothetical protein